VNAPLWYRSLIVRSPMLHRSMVDGINVIHSRTRELLMWAWIPLKSLSW